MKKTAILTILLTVSFLSICYAHPPRLVELQYSADSLELVINVEHLTQKPRKHYIRRLFVYVNGDLVDIIRHINQKHVKGFEDTILLENIEPGDVIKVKAICSKAGYLSGELIVKDEEDDTDQ